MKLKRIDHIGIVVNDIQKAKAFFQDFGFTIQGEATQEGSDLLDKVVGIQNAKSHVIFLKSSDDQITVELTKFLNPSDLPASKESHIYSRGMKHLAFVVDDIDEAIANVKQKGYEIFVYKYNYNNVYKLCYFRGPEGIIIELVEEVK